MSARTCRNCSNDVAARHRDCAFRLAEAAGEDDAVLDALAAYCVRQATAFD